ncbi:MAG: SAM-dependent methyltransferase, partial [bacterium]
MAKKQPSGKVYLVGAGPGDPELLTIKACDLIKQCDVVIRDYLANPGLLRYAPTNAEKIFVGNPR